MDAWSKLYALFWQETVATPAPFSHPDSLDLEARLSDWLGKKFCLNFFSFSLSLEKLRAAKKKKEKLDAEIGKRKKGHKESRWTRGAIYLEQKNSVYICTARSLFANWTNLPGVTLLLLYEETGHPLGLVCHCTSYIRIRDTLSCLKKNWLRKRTLVR